MPIQSSLVLFLACVAERGSLASNASSSPTPGVLCGGQRVVSPSSNWVWSSNAEPSPSCTSPSVENSAQMCKGDPTSVVIKGNGKPQCLSTHMTDCKFNMHDIEQLDFDVNMIGCGGTWAAPLWMSPDHWAGGGAAGEIDMMENCPVDAVYNNFAGGGSPVKVTIADPNSFQGHTTMWKQADQADSESGAMSIHVKTCDPSEVRDGSCQETGQIAYYNDIYGANGCKGQNCKYTLISDIWNGLAGDGGYEACAGGRTHRSTGCHISVANIRFKATPGTFTGKCAQLVSSSPSPRPSPSPGPSPSPSAWPVCDQGDCCNPYTTPKEICQGGAVCQPCGGGQACQCPDDAHGLMV